MNQLAEPFPITLQLRPSRLQGEAFKDAADGLATYRRFWEGSFDRLDEHLESR